MKVAERFSVEARAERLQRRYTGPWRTVIREVGPAEISYRYRRRRRIEWARLDVAGHDLWTHALFRGVVVPALLPIVKRLAAWLG